jgi:hypothetical protein
MAVGCGWLGLIRASECATDTVEGGGPVTPGDAQARELVVNLLDHRFRRRLSPTQEREPVR